MILGVSLHSPTACHDFNELQQDNRDDRSSERYLSTLFDCVCTSGLLSISLTSFTHLGSQLTVFQAIFGTPFFYRDADKNFHLYRDAWILVAVVIPSVIAVVFVTWWMNGRGTGRTRLYAMQILRKVIPRRRRLPDKSVVDLEKVSFGEEASHEE